MKGNLVSLSAALLFAGLMGSTTATAQDVVINELNLVVGPETGQFVELYGTPGTALDGHAVVIVKSAFSNGDWSAQTQAIVDLNGLALDAEGFLALNGEGWQNSVAGVVLAASPASYFELDQTPVFGDMLDAVLYGNTSVSNPQMTAIVEVVNPDAEATVYEGGEGVSPGSDGLSRVPDGGEAFDQAFVMQALSPGSSNMLPCEGGHLALNNPANTVFCTDIGPAIVGFTHQSDAQSAVTSLAIVDPVTGEVLEVFLGTAINMEGLGDGTFEVHAISHDALLAPGWTSLDSIVTVPEGGGVSASLPSP